MLNTTSTVDGDLARLVDEITRQLEAGERVDLSRVANAHPDLLEPLQKLMPALEALVLAGQDQQAALQSESHGLSHAHRRQLGDFRLIREIGRGGMGTVFEAEQLSMGRRVALKVLPFAALANEKSLQRFRNEVRAAAALDHPHIVSVYSVGEERGIHYFAMQLIRGQTLADMIGQLRSAARPDALRADSPAPGEAPTIDSAIAPEPDTKPVAHARVSTAVDARAAAERFRAFARLGIQAAEALQHAHDQGVLHRDIKPSNLILDAGGQLYITDFGLARIEADAGMTMTGDIVGTLRYMAPEQALAKRVVVDQRADVYSLGATLYELLTLEPAFAETDRSELLKQIAFEEPRPPRKLDRQIPAELETIVLKAMEKNPDVRYHTAERLADDLRAYIDHRPIKAKPSSWKDRLVKWSRRHPAGVRASLLAMFTTSAVAAASVGWVVRDRTARRTAAETTANIALGQASQLSEQSHWAEALSAINRADELLASSGAEGALRRSTQQMKKNVEMAQRLESIRLSPTTRIAGDAQVYDPDADREYVSAFRQYGIDVQSLAPQVAAERIRESPISLELVEGLDNWAVWRMRNIDDDSWMKLFEVAGAVDSDSWRSRWREATAKNDEALKVALVNESLSLSVDKWDPHNLSRMFNLSLESIGVDQAIELLRAFQQRHPDSFWVNYYLGAAFLKRQPPDPLGAARYISVALALRPNSWVTRNLLGTALLQGRNAPEARRVFKEALQLDPKNAFLLTNLGSCLDDSDQALALFKQAIRFKPDLAAAHSQLGTVLQSKGLLDEAIASYKEAIRLNPKDAKTHEWLGHALKEKGLVDEAIGHFNTSIKLESDRVDLSLANYQLSEALNEMGLLEEARSLYVGRLKSPQDLTPRMRRETLVSISQLAETLRRIGRADDANALYEESIQLQLSQFGLLDANTLALYRAAGRLDEAIAAGEEALKASLGDSGPKDSVTLANRLFLAKAFDAARRHAEAEKVLRLVLADTNDAQQTLEARFLLAGSLLRLGQSEEGVGTLTSLYEDRLRTLTAPDAIELRRNWPNLPNTEQAPQGTPGQDGLAFDGAHDYVILPRLHFDGRPPWTLETIVKPAVMDRRFGTWTSLVSAASQGSIGVDSDQGRWSVGMYSTPVVSDVWLQNYASAPARDHIVLNKWQHVAGVWDGQELRLYINGTLQARRENVTYCTRLSLEPFFLGADPGNIAEGYFHGRMRAARISRGVEYMEDFATPDRLAKTPQTIALYDFTSDTGRYAVDRSDKGHHGIIVGAHFVKANE